MSIYDTIIIGSGPAGLTASIYASCFKLNHIVIGKVFGGQMILSPDIVNYPGFIKISGNELTEKMVAQTRFRGGMLIEDSVIEIKKTFDNTEQDKPQRNIFSVKTEKGQEYQALSIILATGTERRKLNVPGELDYTAKGVHYCVICEKQDYEGKVVTVVGGGNSAAQGAIQLAHGAEKVYILSRSKELRCDPMWIEQMKKYPNIEIWYEAAISEILGDSEKVTSIKVKKEERETEIILSQIYIEIGGVPGTALLSPLGVIMDEGGYIKVDQHLTTNIEGVFAAGDLVSYGLSIEQISTAVGLGARAAASAFSFIKKGKAPSAWGSILVKR